MKKKYQYITFLLLLFALANAMQLVSCSGGRAEEADKVDSAAVNNLVAVDTSKMPGGKYGDAVRYGRELMLHTAYYIGPEGINGHYTGNKMNCTNCHRDAGTRPYAFNLVRSFRDYPQYRAREGRILSLAERINNCVMRPNLGKPLPLDGKEMISIMAYLKFLSDSSNVSKTTKGLKNMEVELPDVAASSDRGEVLYAQNCERCHAKNGEGKMRFDNVTYEYPPVWGLLAYRPGSSMHRVVKLAQWLKGNMPYDKTAEGKPFLTDAQALDIAAFVNDDKKHKRPLPKTTKEVDYPHYEEKAIDYDKGPFKDPFSEQQHKYGPYKPIIDYWEGKGITPSI
ncbi:thiosulfate dehydrogenase [Mucilaginibacter gossypiicola]|uniref:Thiosulfate dehydrogenase n=1 Tax=Mucilaginibacter gossypiicola TaxID=551995 RepID=A0A1H8G7K8_9SPHI|nr:c-type cytochrome [Mucilaginibacter gossypiicola]SEN40012.1 thiosulfate dehydrogenase [Mucilaginibacter gossypiicola]